MGWVSEKLGVVFVAYVEMFPCCGAPRSAPLLPASHAVDPGGRLLRDKAARTKTLPISTLIFDGFGCMELFLHSPIYLNGMVLE